MRVRGKHLRLGSGLALAALSGLALPMKTSASIIAAYNFGPTSTSFTYAATTLAANVTASGINSTNDFGSADVFSTDAGIQPGWYTNNPGGGPNMLSVESSQSASDDNFWIELIVTPAANYEINPTSFELYGGAGGSSVTRTAYVYDSVDDALDPNITPNASTPPSGTNTVANPLQASGNFTATPSIRSSSDPMTEIQVASFPADDAGQTSSYTVRIYFDTNGNVDKNIDLGYLELDGTVVPVPEPLTSGLLVTTAIFGLGIRRRRGALVH